MATIQTSLITQGAAVKDNPNMNAGDLIMQVDAMPTATADLVTPIVPTNNEPPAGNAIPNVAVIGTETPGKSKIGLWLAAGFGAYLVFSPDGKKAVQGITGIGKKKKTRKEKSSAMPIILIGGAAAALYFLSKKDDTAETPGSDPNNNTPADNTPAPPAGMIFTPITVPTTDAAIHQILFNYSTPWRYAVDRMTPAERLTLYLYVYGYIERKIHLYNFPGVFPDGNYDPQLYADVQALSDKWNLQLLY